MATLYLTTLVDHLEIMSPITSNARIIALCGDEGVGKSYLAANSGRRVVSFADPLRDIISVMTGIPSTDLKQQDVKKMPLDRLHLFGDARGTVRDLLIDVGGFMRKYNNDYFMLTAVDRLNSPGQFIIDDLRFDHEAEILRKHFDADEVEIIRVTSEATDVGDWHRDKYSIVGFKVDSVYHNRRAND